MDDLLKKAEKYALAYAETEIPSVHVFHASPHFREAVQAAKELAKGYNMTPEEIIDIQIAMWFHDLGFSGGGENHEERSMEIAESFLNKEAVEEARIEKVKQYIAATDRSHKPDGLMEEIVNDADTAHIGSKKYFDILGLLRTEWESRLGKKYDEEEWLKLNIEFLEEHRFYSGLAKTKYGRRKRKNMLKLQKRYQELLDFKREKIEGADPNELMSVPKKADRGVETMFRVTLRNHNNLSRIADNKANIMLSINAIMLSIVISSLTPKLDSNPRLIIPTIIIIIVCLISIILATLSTRPKITSANYSDEKFLSSRFNILFFGNFYQMPLDKFEWGIQNLMKNEKLLYSSLSKDLYYLGLVLAKKYRYLYIGYNVFMYGLVVAAIAFIISFLPDGPV
ncbi:MAG: phosphohydrolase [Saprospiraceae bacterium]|nr:phosphohydrolase [Saprospiraceae bacterium]